MNVILSIPIEVRLTVLFALGTAIGGAVNWAVYGLAWFPRPISPWSRPDPAAPPRRRWDRVPVLGWLGLRREAGLHGSCFWIRPMLLELGAGVGLAWLYWWETVAARLVLPVAAQPGAFDPETLRIFHLEFAAHAVLLALMLAASMIDVDEKTIPDAITTPGTLAGLAIAAVWPWSLLPDIMLKPPFDLVFLDLTSPNPWPAWLIGYPAIAPLAIGLGCWLLWCAALLPRTWYARHGWRRALRLCWTRMLREPSARWVFKMAILGALLITLVWLRSGLHWQALLSALVGMAAGGGLIWLVRIIGSAALRREAMGFGDVTLMAMIGAFLGWQPCLIIFFLAPLAGLVVGVLRMILLRDREIPYGPFLCLASLFLIVQWNWVRNTMLDVFSLGWMIPLAMAVCMALIPPILFALLAVKALTLGVWRRIRGPSR